MIKTVPLPSSVAWILLHHFLKLLSSFFNCKSTVFQLSPGNIDFMQLQRNLSVMSPVCLTDSNMQLTFPRSRPPVACLTKTDSLRCEPAIPKLTTTALGVCTNCAGTQRILAAKSMSASIRCDGAPKVSRALVHLRRKA